MDSLPHRRPSNLTPPNDVPVWIYKELQNQSALSGYVGFFRYLLLVGIAWTYAGYGTPPGVIGYQLYYSENTGTGGPWTLFSTLTVENTVYFKYTSDSIPTPGYVVGTVPSTARAVKLVVLTAGDSSHLTTILYGDLDLI